MRISIPGILASALMTVLTVGSGQALSADHITCKLTESNRVFRIMMKGGAKADVHVGTLATSTAAKPTWQNVTVSEDPASKVLEGTAGPENLAGPGASNGCTVLTHNFYLKLSPEGAGKYRGELEMTPYYARANAPAGAAKCKHIPAPDSEVVYNRDVLCIRAN